MNAGEDDSGGTNACSLWRPAQSSVNGHALRLAQVAIRIRSALVAVDDGLDNPGAALPDDHPAVLPPVPRLAIDTQTPARLRDRDSLLQQLRKRPLLVHHRLSSRTTRRTRSHTHLHTSGVATTAGIRRAELRNFSERRHGHLRCIQPFTNQTRSQFHDVSRIASEVRAGRCRGARERGPTPSIPASR